MRRNAAGSYTPRAYAIDTLLGIARRFGANVYTLQYTNGIVNWNVVISFSNC